MTGRYLSTHPAVHVDLGLHEASIIQTEEILISKRYSGSECFIEQKHGIKSPSLLLYHVNNYLRKSCNFLIHKIIELAIFSLQKLNEKLSEIELRETAELNVTSTVLPKIGAGK